MARFESAPHKNITGGMLKVAYSMSNTGRIQREKKKESSDSA